MPRPRASTPRGTGASTRPIPGLSGAWSRGPRRLAARPVSGRPRSAGTWTLVSRRSAARAPAGDAAQAVERLDHRAHLVEAPDRIAPRYTRHVHAYARIPGLTPALRRITVHARAYVATRARPRAHPRPRPRARTHARTPSTTRTSAHARARPATSRRDLARILPRDRDVVEALDVGVDLDDLVRQARRAPRHDRTRRAPPRHDLAARALSSTPSRAPHADLRDLRDLRDLHDLRDLRIHASTHLHLHAPPHACPRPRACTPSRRRVQTPVSACAVLRLWHGGRFHDCGASGCEGSLVGRVGE